MSDQRENEKPVVFIGSRELAQISSLLPSNKNRSAFVHSLISALGLLNNTAGTRRRLKVVPPHIATFKDLSAYHTSDYLLAVFSPELPEEQTEHAREINAEFGLEDDCPPFPGMTEYVQFVGGATLTAVKALQHNLSEIAICWDGGRHHARKSQASGFCYVADCILAILALKRPPANMNAPIPHKPRVMYLDLDLHFSDAVSEAFYSTTSSVTRQVLTLSIHHSSPGFFPVSERAALPDASDRRNFDPFTLSVPLKQGASSKTYARIWPIVEQLRMTFNPDYVVLQCGVDALAGDPCSTFNWSLGDGEGSMGWCIGKVVREWPGKKLFLGGGGYNSQNAARAWAYLTSVALGSPFDLETQIPDHAAFPHYEPSFTLDVPAGNMFDHNSEDYLSSIEGSYKDIIMELKKCLNLM